jgi:hypothetical protein
VHVKKKSKTSKNQSRIYRKKIHFFRLWQIKGNALQGDVQPYCSVSLALRFKLARPGSIVIEYNLATSDVFGSVNNQSKNCVLIEI